MERIAVFETVAQLAVTIAGFTGGAR